jgi:hypothetical protein
MIQFSNCVIVGDGIDHDQYAKQPEGVKRGDAGYVMSRGELMTFAKNPAKWLAGVEDEDTKSTEWGDLVDSMLLSPAKFEVKFVVAPATYPEIDKKGKLTGNDKPWNWNAKYCTAWRDEKVAAGLTVTTDTEMKKATTALVALQRNSDIMELVECSKAQVMVTGEYHDRATGLKIKVKILIDLVPDKKHERFGKCLADFKTAKNAAMFEFGRAINQHHYDAQCGLYLPMYVSATGEDRTDWKLAVQESGEPYYSEIYTLNGAFGEQSEGGSFISNGEIKIRKALALYCWCLKNNLWPGYWIAARLRWNGIAIIESEAWMSTALADFCRIPELPVEKTEQEKKNDVTP